MSVRLGSGEHTYRVVESWAKLPDGWELMDVGAVACDSKDRVYVFCRGEHPMIVFDRDGNFIKSWGEGTFPRAHGLHIDEHDQLYCTDDGGHFVRKCTTDGKVLLELGVPGKPAPFMSGQPFHRCTHTALSPKGEIYVSDGYGNAVVHKFTPDGRLIKSWGEQGTGPGQFNLVHNIVTDKDGWVYVADRENHRVQVFDGNGRYETEWHNLHRPCGRFGLVDAEQGIIQRDGFFGDAHIHDTPGELRETERPSHGRGIACSIEDHIRRQLRRQVFQHAGFGIQPLHKLAARGSRLIDTGPRTR